MSRISFLPFSCPFLRSSSSALHQSRFFLSYVLFPALYILIAFGLRPSFSAEPVSAFDSNIWIRTIPSDLKDVRNLMMEVLPGTDFALVARANHINGVPVNIAMRFFSGEVARWTDIEKPSAWVGQLRDISETGAVGRNPFRNQSFNINGSLITFYYSYTDDSTPTKETSSWLRQKHGGIDIPDACKDVAADWMEIKSGGKVERKVLVYLFESPASPPNNGPCWAPHDPVDPFQPPYDRIRAVVPLLRGVALQDNSLLVISQPGSYVDMPIILRLTADLNSPAIDNKRLFLLKKDEVDSIRNAAMGEFQRREANGDYRGNDNPVAPLAAMIEDGLIKLLKKNEGIAR